MADPKKKPFSEVVAENLIAQLKAGTAPWQRPWNPGDPSGFLPMNPTTGNRYHGINSIHLMSQFRSDPRWMTYKQAAAIGAQVRKGEKSTWIQIWRNSDERVKTDDTGKPFKDKDGNTVKEVVQLERPFVSSAYVFNAEQIDGLPPLESKRQELDWEVMERAERILAASGANISHSNGDRAFYRPSSDSITLPEKSQFPSADNYYATALHELGHWTGHHTRLDRDLAHPFGSEGYAKEELRAEIASMILGVELGLGHDPGQHAAYVKSWIKVLENDHLEIFRAAADAEKIQKFVMAFEQQQTQQRATKQEQASAFFNSRNQLLDAQTGEALAGDWQGLAQGEGQFWYIGQDAGERSFTALTAQTISDARKEAAIASALQVDISHVLNDPDLSFSHFEAFKGETLEAALRSRGLTTIGNVTGRDVTEFYTHAHNMLSPAFGIDPTYAETDNAYLERKGLAQAFMGAAERLVMQQDRTQTNEQESVAQVGLPTVDAQTRPVGRLTDWLTENRVMRHGDAVVASARRDLFTGSEATLEIDRMSLAQESEKHLLFKIPASWTGEVQTRGMVEIDGNIVPADDVGVPPAFYGVYLRTMDEDGDGELTYEWVIDYANASDAQQLAGRLALIDAYSQPDDQTRSEKLARIESMKSARDTTVQQPGPAVVLSDSDRNVLDPLLIARAETAQGRTLGSRLLETVSLNELGFPLPATWTGESRVEWDAETSGGEETFEAYWVEVEVMDDAGKRFVEAQHFGADVGAAYALVDRLDTIQAYSLADANERDAQLTKIAQRTADADPLSRLPDYWTGELAVLPLLVIDGERTSAEASGVEPEFHGVYLATADERGEKQWVLLEDYDTQPEAEALAAQLDQRAAELMADNKLAKLRPANASDDKTYINVHFRDKNEAKELGARWDKNHGDKGSWYVPAGVDLSAFEKWMPKAENASIAPPRADVPGTPLTEGREAAVGAAMPAQAASKAAHEMTQAEFEQVARAVKLENHGRQWEIFVGERSYGFADAPEQADAIREAHKREVNNALYFNSEDAPLDADVFESMGGKPGIPSTAVLADYPDLQEKFAAVIAAAPAPQGNIATEITWLSIPYSQREAAKSLAGTLADGSKAIAWNKQENTWYAKPGADLDKLKMWLPENVRDAQGPAQSPREEFAEALRAMKCLVEGEHPIMDGKRHRIRVEGDSKSATDKTGGGTYIGHLPEPGSLLPNGAPEIPAGYIKNHRTQIDMKWKAKGYTLTEEEKAKMHAAAAQKRQEAEAKQTATYERISKRVQGELVKLAPLTDATPYMKKKGIEPQPGAFTDADKLTTYLPAYDATGKQWTMQYINSDGSSKRFAKDGRKEGAFHVVGGNGPASLADAPAIVIGEGYATMSSATKALQFPTVTAFDSGNLKAVAMALHETYPDKPFVFLGDDDTHLVNHPQIKRNTGRIKAEEAAREVGGTAIFPIFAPGEQQGDPAGFTDFNDLSNKSMLGPEGLERQVKGFVDDVIAKHQNASQIQEQAQEQVQERVQTQEVKRTRSVRM